MNIKPWNTFGNMSSEGYFMCLSTHYNTVLLLFYSMSNNYWAVSSGEKIRASFCCYYSYNYIECTKLISDHEIPLAICLLKGISCVSTQYNTGLLLFYSM